MVDAESSELAESGVVLSMIREETRIPSTHERRRAQNNRSSSRSIPTKKAVCPGNVTRSGDVSSLNL